MIFSIIFELGLVVGVSVVAHAAIAYVLAPRKAKQGILDAFDKASVNPCIFGWCDCKDYEEVD